MVAYTAEPNANTRANLQRCVILRFHDDGAAAIRVFVAFTSQRMEQKFGAPISSFWFQDYCLIVVKAVVPSAVSLILVLKEHT